MQRGDEILVLITPDGYYDFPGGRVDESEVELPLAEILQREIQEELGDKLTFEVGKFAFVTKRRYDRNGHDYRVLAIYFETKYIDGDLLLSDEHAQSRWFKRNDIPQDPNKFISKDEYEQLNTYLGR